METGLPKFEPQIVFVRAKLDARLLGFLWMNLLELTLNASSVTRLLSSQSSSPGRLGYDRFHTPS